MMTLVLALIIAGEVLLLAPSLYLLFLTLAGLLYRPPADDAGLPYHRFAVLIPSHNEEDALPALLRSLQETDYPRNLYDVFVVADNCTDATANVARSWGVTVYGREDPARRGKGYALRWLLERVRACEGPHDAYVVLDADCRVSANFLSALACRFQRGSRAAQVYYTAADPFQAPASAIRSIALVLKHYVRPRGRARLGLSCGLFGTGMAFRRDDLDEYGWDAFTLAEDVEYFLGLTERGVKVDFIPNATVWSPMPESLQDARSQNLRWEKGRLTMLARYGPRLLWQGIRKRDFARVDAMAEQAIPPLSVAVMAALALLAAALVSGRVWPVALGLAVNVALLGHAFIGLASARAPFRAYRALVHVPPYMLWKLLLYLLAFLPGKGEWVRTRRS